MKLYRLKIAPPALYLLLVSILFLIACRSTITRAASGYAVIRVQYLDGSPKSGALVIKTSPLPTVTLGISNQSGLVTSFGVLTGPQNYIVEAYSGSQFGNDTSLHVDANGDGSTTIQANYEITPPAINILSPQNQTYLTRPIPLTYAVYDFSPISWTGYSLDGQPNITITGNTTLTGLSFGSHSVVICSNDTFGNMGFSGTIYFQASGRVIVRVQYLDGAPRPGADVWIINGSQIGTTDSNGEAKTDGLSPAGYNISAFYQGLQFGQDTFLSVDSNGNGSATITVDYEITPPAITILSPQNQTYTNRTVPLTYTIYDYSPISWTGYSLDGQPNITITGNTTLTGLSFGSHSVVICSNDTFGNMGSCNTVYLTVQRTGIVTIRVQYLDGAPRPEADVWIINGSQIGTTDSNGEAKSDWLDPGDYNVRAYYPPSSGQFGQDTFLDVDDTGYGYVAITAGYEITPPTILIISPQNQTYSGNFVPLTFSVHDYSSISWIGYSLDGQPNVTTTGNTTLALEEGAHHVVFYANDTFGNMGSSQTVYFTYSTKAQVTFTQTGVGSDYTDTVVDIDGTNYKRTDLPVSFNWDIGSNHSFAYQSPLIARANAERYAWYSTAGPVTLQSGNINVTIVQTITGNYERQYYLDVSSPYDSPNPTSNWFDENTNIAASVTSVVSGPTGIRQVCTGWTGTGSVPLNGTGSPLAFVITQPSSITWNWKTQCLLTLSTIPNSLSPQPSRNPTGEPASADSWWYDSSTSVILRAGTVENYTFDFWILDGVSQSHGVISVPVTMTTPLTAIANFTSNSAIPDVAVLNLTESRTVVGQGYTVIINVTVGNERESTESFNLTVYANTTAVDNQVLVLEGGNSTAITVVWNTTGIGIGNYNVSAYAWPVLSETNISNNNFTGGRVIVAIVGDITSLNGLPDGKVDMRDVSYVARRFLCSPGDSLWDPNADINGDAKIDMKDIATVAKHFEEHYP